MFGNRGSTSECCYIQKIKMICFSLYTFFVIKKLTNATHYIFYLFFKLLDFIVLPRALF